MTKPTVLVLSQVYPPDTPAVGQYMADAAQALTGRGYRVVTLTSMRGYEDPSKKFPKHEVSHGVSIRRLPLSSFGKSSILIRIIGGISFTLQCIFHGLFIRNLECILVSTSPPMCSAAALVISTFRRRAAITYWMMDLNPDQSIELGLVKPTSPVVKLFNWFNRRVLNRAKNIVTLDKFMAERVLKKADVRDKLTIMPPWPLDGHLESVEHEKNPFRSTHKLNGHFVIMYSGNHSTFTPLDTILEAALRLRDDDRLRFLFIGGGSGKPQVDETIAEHRLTNVVSLPYQPLEQIKYSLSAADVHLVVLGNTEVGVRHPCKVYGAMALERPVLLLGPNPSHVSELVTDLQIGWHVQHGQVDEVVRIIREMVNTPPAELSAMGQRARAKIECDLSTDKLRGEFCDLIDQSRSSLRLPHPN
jgi:glycosyltransferase involved in cell wall biosynthesis